MPRLRETHHYLERSKQTAARTLRLRFYLLVLTPLQAVERRRQVGPALGKDEEVLEAALGLHLREADGLGVGDEARIDSCMQVAHPSIESWPQIRSWWSCLLYTSPSPRDS